MKRERENPVGSKYLEQCDFLEENSPVAPFIMVICGGRGDLSRRKLLPTLYHLFIEKILPENFAIIGFGSSHDLDDVKFRKIVKHTLEEFVPELYEMTIVDKFIENIFFIKGQFQDDKIYLQLLEKIYKHFNCLGCDKTSLIFYMAVHPDFFPLLIDKFGEHNLNARRFNPKIIIEKPFGTDEKSATNLNIVVEKVFSEKQIFRIDHYLGKETLQNIIFFRFSNSIFEPLWNNNYIDNVQITVAEDLGIEHRGKFYEKAGIIRDIVQNHILQIIGLIAMEPPVGFSADLIRDERVKIFRSIRPYTALNCKESTVLGQYGKNQDGSLPAYREEEDVASDSVIPTYFAGKFYIDNWRWANVPFYVRCGKRLPHKLTQIVIQFKSPSLQLFGRICDKLEPGYLIITVQPREAISLRISVKYPNSSYKIVPVNLNFCYGGIFKEKRYSAYSRLLIDCMKNDLTLFVRKDGVAAMWSVVDPIIQYWENKQKNIYPNYRAQSWGPTAADDMLAKDGRPWNNFSEACSGY